MTKETERAELDLPPLPSFLVAYCKDTQQQIKGYARSAIEQFLNTSGQHITNDATRQAAIDAAIEHDRKQRGEPVSALADLVNALRDRHYGRMPDEVQKAYDRAWAIVFTAPQPAEPVAKESLMDRCYQDADGTIPVSGIGQPVGLFVPVTEPPRPAPEDEAWDELERRQ
ncbi:hypothetical protein H0A71_05905 [Alcaligenaceae bacterium]|nr:hypothetical protein [Alcaligenaceae bacterium]